MPLTDRVDYLANMINNLVLRAGRGETAGRHREMPESAQMMRVLLSELQRINSHCVWLGTHALDIGAMTVFFYCFREREDILRIFEMFSGQRMMTSYIRPRRSRAGAAARLGQGCCNSSTHSRRNRRIRRPAEREPDLAPAHAGRRLCSVTGSVRVGVTGPDDPGRRPYGIRP